MRRTLRRGRRKRAAPATLVRDSILNKCDGDSVQLMMIDSPLKKLLVRKVGSNKFLKATGRWTKKAEAAFNFPTLVDAIHTCLTKGLQEVEFILRFEGDSEDQCFALNLA